MVLAFKAHKLILKNDICVEQHILCVNISEEIWIKTFLLGNFRKKVSIPKRAQFFMDYLNTELCVYD